MEVQGKSKCERGQHSCNGYSPLGINKTSGSTFVFNHKVLLS